MTESWFAALESAGVRWCVLYQGELPGAAGEELDVLVGSADRELAECSLAALDFLPLSSQHQATRREWLAYAAPAGCWVRVNVLTRLAYGMRLIFPAETSAGILERRLRQGTAYSPDPDDAFWVLLLRCLLISGGIGPAERAHLLTLSLTARPDGPLAAILPGDWPVERLIAAARAGDWDSLLQFATHWLARRTLGWGGALNRVLRRLPGRSHPPGLNVALLGSDGAGKSTVVEAVQRSFYFPVRTLYMGLSEERVPLVARLQPRALRGLVFLLVLWANYLAALVHRARGRLVIFDRYTYDALLPPRQRLSPLMAASRWLRAHLLPPPDLVLVLDVPGAVMYARKGEHDPAHLEAERQDYLALQRRIANAEIVDGTRLPGAVGADVVARIWRRQVLAWKEGRS
ncbi:MAG: hypothetical protein HPY64_01935 [Anaerolineae bacterium]|nr:hypothetical protein [Anaerolineae bacterium]